MLGYTVVTLSQVIPMEQFNLHMTGDIHAIGNSVTVAL
jgi:formyltetrahydrofolate synthetase